MKKKLLAYYEHHLAIIKKSKKGFNWICDYLDEYSLEFGLCNCANNVFKRNIYFSQWTKKHTTANNAWYKYPSNCSSKKEIIECLEYRINKLKQLI